MTMLRQPERFCLETTPSTVCGMTQRLLVQISNTRTRKNRRQAKLNSWRQDPRQHAALATRRRGCNATTNWWDPRTNVSRGYAHSAAAATIDYDDDDDDDDDDDGDASGGGCHWLCGRPDEYTQTAPGPTALSSATYRSFR